MALVLLPGLDGTGRLFSRFVAALPPECEPQVAAYPGDRRLSLDEHVELALEQFPPGPVSLLAESFSGLVALALLSRPHPPIDRVVFCAAFAAPPRPFLRAAARLPGAGHVLRSAPDFALRRYCLGSDAAPGSLDEMRAALSGVSADVLAHRLGLIGTTHAPAPMRRDVPCLYLKAADDRLVPKSAADWFAGHFSNFELARIDGPHLLLQVRPEACAREVTRFVAAGPA